MTEKFVFFLTTNTRRIFGQGFSLTGKIKSFLPHHLFLYHGDGNSDTFLFCRQRTNCECGRSIKFGKMNTMKRSAVLMEKRSVVWEEERSISVVVKNCLMELFNRDKCVCCTAKNNSLKSGVCVCVSVSK